MGLHLFQDVPIRKLQPALHEVKEAVEEDVRALWAGVEALRLHELPAANDPEPETPAPEKPWRLPLGWISLAAAAALLAGLGLAQIEVQRRLVRPEASAPQNRAAPKKRKKLRRVRVPNRSEYSRVDGDWR